MPKFLGSLWERNLSFRSDQIRSVAQSCPTLCDPMNHSTPGLPVHHQLPEFTETHIHRVSDAIRDYNYMNSESQLIKMKRQRIISQVKVQDKTARKTTNWSGDSQPSRKRIQDNVSEDDPGSQKKN